MQSVTKETDVQLSKPAVLYKYRRVSKDKNCQATICDKKQKKCDYDEFKSQSSRCSDKNCQENENINMHSVLVTNTEIMNMQLPKPAMRRLCSDKKCQSTRCYKKQSPMRPMHDKNCKSV